jgi:hypothetical protein
MPVIQDAVLRGATLVMNHTLAEAFWQAAMETEATHLVKIKELPFLPDGVVLCVDPDVKLEDVLRDEGFDFDLSSIQPNTDLN